MQCKDSDQKKIDCNTPHYIELILKLGLGYCLVSYFVIKKLEACSQII